MTKDHGFTYFQSTNESEYATNLEQAASSNYKLVFGIGFALRNAVESAAKDHSDINYVIIDDEIKGQKNVASALFADNEAAYLAGVAAAKTTKTIGNFWHYLVISCTRILFPMSLIVGFILILEGTPMGFESKMTIPTLEGSEQIVSQGPTAAIVPIKQIGTI